MFVGRSRELGLLERSLDEAASGRGSLRVLIGEPGIGKTRLADEVAARATERGFLASWGRAWETGGAPAYWPWIEMLGPLAEAAPEIPVRVRALLGSPEGPASEDGMRANPARDRFELFEAVSTFVRSSARERPLLLVFDDLHVADVPSLELLCFVARGLRSSRIVALCTYRDAEARLPPVADSLARLGRECEPTLLRPLTREDVEQVLSHELSTRDAALRQAVSELTEGNPLFLRETIHAVNADAGGLSPEALREVAALGGVLTLARGRLAGAGNEMRATLELAAVCGREFQSSLLAAASAEAPDAVLAALEDAMGRGLLVRRAEDRWAFPHVLVREAFYRDLGVERRRALHHAIASALARRWDDGVVPSARVATRGALATLAHHQAAALPLGDPVAAVRTACRAAAHARRQLAYEEAISLLERALATCEEHALAEREQFEVALALGWAATEAGRFERGRELFRHALRLGREVGDPMLIARAALGQGGQYVFAEIRPELVEALREGLDALVRVPGDEARRLRARSLARLAAALTPSLTPEEPLGLARVALAMTEGETDVPTRIDVDVGVGAALTDFAPAGERIRVNERLLRDARQVADRVLELRALTRLSCDFLEHGDVAQAEAAIEARTALADSLGHPRYAWQSPLLRSMHAMPHGRFDECEAFIGEARRISAEASDPNAERCIEFHRFSLLLVSGRLEGLREQEARAHRTLLTLAGNSNLKPWLSAVATARLGERQRAATIMRAIPPHDSAARMQRVTLLEAAVLCDANDAVERLLATFDPDDSNHACWGPFAFACAAPIARTLAMAAFALGRRDEALRHIERALELVARTGADAHRAWVHLAMGEGTGEREHLERALEIAERLGMPEVSTRARSRLPVEPPRAAMPPAGSDPPRPSSPPLVVPDVPAFAIRHDPGRHEWIIERGGREFRLKDARGLVLLARLVDQPGREIHALDLAAEGDDPPFGSPTDLGDAGEVIDLRARAAYKARLDDLREGLAEAEGFSDLVRAERIRAEIEALAQQLAAAVGLGGRERRAGSHAERARVAVQRRIREAIKKIASHDRELGRHLDWAVRTGTFCIYEPAGKNAPR